ncbi:MAG: tetratricopeptide repeat protein [Bacteroidia bacterium]|nr:tetratricopeptide repeat protein [Bacteroidia bacterium]
MAASNTKNKITVLIINLFVFAISSIAQNHKEIDSLLYALKITQNDTSKVNILNSLSALTCSFDPEKAIQYGKQGLRLAQTIDYKKGMAYCYNNIGQAYVAQGNYQEALSFYNKSMEIKKAIGDKKGIAYSYTNIGIVYWNQNNYTRAIDYYQKSLRLFEEINDTREIADCYNCIGAIHSDQGGYDKAIEYYSLSLKIHKELQDKNGISSCLNNIGLAYFYKGENDTAAEYFFKSFKIFEDIGDKKGISAYYSNIGLVHFSQKKYDAAIEDYFKALKIDEELGDKNGISISYLNITSLKIMLKKYLPALEYAQKSLALSKEAGSLDNEKMAYEYLSIINDSLHNYAEAYTYHKLYKLINDSIFNEESSKQLKEMEARYQSEKKQKEIELKETQLAKKDIEVKQQRIQKLAFIGGFVLMMVLSVVIFKSYSIKKKTNILLTAQKQEIEEKNEELNRQNAEIAAQRDEIEAQRDLVTKQKEHIEQIHEELTDSIHYAERIQKAVLPSSEFIENIIRRTGDRETGGMGDLSRSPIHPLSPSMEFFILFKPKDIVSGDFYWMAKRNNQLLIAVADCTGHGVPGAFMSMLGVSFINEIVARKDVTTASQVLDELRKHIIQSLQQKGISGEQKDGMDIAFITLNLDTLMQFAGANNPVWIIKKQQEAVSVGSETPELPTANYQLPTTNYRCQLPTIRNQRRQNARSNPRKHAALYKPCYQNTKR